MHYSLLFGGAGAGRLCQLYARKINYTSLKRTPAGEQACGAYQVGALGLAIHGDGRHELDVEEARRLRLSL